MTDKNPLPLKIAYYTITDPMDKRSWSGITYYLGQALLKHVGKVHFLGPVQIPWWLDKLCRALQKLSRFCFKTEWIPKYSLIKNIYAAYVLKKRMHGQSYDFLIAPAAASELAFLKTNIPVIYFGDATFKLYSSMYTREFSRVSAISKWEGNFLESRALNKSNLVLFSSQWALRSATNDYGISPDRGGVIQMGANIDTVPVYQDIFLKEAEKPLTLLFLSVDWERKGGDIAFETLLLLEKRGLKVRLIVCGCIPPANFHHPSMTVVPFLNKNDPDDLQVFVKLISSVHFLLLPTRADCTPMVNCEANAYGVPVITTDVGGISEAISNGVNGYCLPLTATAEDYAQQIQTLFADKAAYRRLIVSSRKRFDEELNWAKFASNLLLQIKNKQLI